MNDWKLKTTIAFLIFNRPDATERVFEEIGKAKPPMLLVIADGPRAQVPEDAEKCAASRAIIEQADWDCRIVKNYSDINMGCRNRVSSGLNWVFDTVEKAIILEDDCLPSPSFFRFCQELLTYYQDDVRVMTINGTNWQLGWKIGDGSYYFSRFNLIWGWATWRRAWTLISLYLWEQAVIKKDYNKSGSSTTSL